jgi:competence protein ComEC
MEQDRKKAVIWALIFLGAANILAWSFIYELSRGPLLEVNFFDVGQGDAAFIETPLGHQILIDGGPDDSVLEKLGREMPFWDRTIDLIVLTHPEHDHISGLLEAMDRYEVERVMWTGVLRDTAEYQEWLRLLEGEEAEVTTAEPGQKIVSSDAVFTVLFPSENLWGEEVGNTNNSSIIMKLDFGETSFLFTGDAYQSVERKLIVGGADVASDVLKVGHHGSKTSTAEDFLAVSSPQTAVISVGEGNSYGHPDPEVLELLNKYDINVLRTDQQGDIKMLSDGSSIAIQTEKQ